MIALGSQLIKSILKFLLTTLSIALFGLLLMVVGGLLISDKTSPSPILIVGSLFLLFSPVLSAIIFWIKHRKRVRREHQLAIEKRSQLDQNARDEAARDLLRRRFLERQRLIDSIDQHRSALQRNLERAVRKNDYGKLVDDTTDEALNEFFASIDLNENSIDFNEAKSLVFEQLDFRMKEEHAAGFDTDNLPFDGHTFEQWVAQGLRVYGWEAQVTSGSGDQGIDVLAQKDGRELGLQCKLYSSSIGNKAIQEAHAGKAFYGLEVVGVISNAQFTSSAKDLATMTGVKLFSHHDIPKMFETAFPKG